MSSVAVLSSSSSSTPTTAARSTKPSKIHFWSRVFSSKHSHNKVHNYYYNSSCNNNSSSSNNNSSNGAPAVCHSPTAAMNNAGNVADNNNNEGLSTTIATTTTNVLQWMESSECPPDVLPLVLAFCGPQTAAALSKCNRHWMHVMQSEGTWRVLCEELYKWKAGDEEPSSWAEHYRLNPCVPVDYSTVNKALQVSTKNPPITKSKSRWNVAMANNKRSLQQQQQQHQQVHPIRILLRPGNHYIKETIHIQAKMTEGAITIETLELPPNTFRPVLSAKSRQNTSNDIPEGPLSRSSSSASSSSSSSTKSSPGRSLRNFMRCHRSDSVEDPNNNNNNNEATEFSEDEDSESDWLTQMIIHPTSSSSSSSSTLIQRSRSRMNTTRAALIFRSRRTNEPAIRISEGNLRLNNVDISHHSEGLDIWNGNAAIQIQPTDNDDDNNDEQQQQQQQPNGVRRHRRGNSNIHPRPTAILKGVHVTSLTGRGIVTIDGGSVLLQQTAVTDCAATGIYIGGPGSQAVIEATDVLRNGVGNRSPRIRIGGVARGHSGIYLEQGVARIVDSNISSNTLTGISAVSPDNAILKLEHCDLMSNGTNQLEMPQNGSLARQHSYMRHNQMSLVGRGRSRSGLKAATMEPPPTHRMYGTYLR